MCETCPAHMLGPGEVAGKVARSKLGRRVMFWGLAIPMFLGIIVYTLGWWLVPIALGLGALAAGVLLAVRGLHRHALVVAPASLRPALPASALPRNRAITAGQRAIGAPTVVAGSVVGYNKTAEKLEVPRVLPGQVLTAAEGEKVKR